MLKHESEHTLTPSLLDRLLDNRPEEKRESITERLQNLSQLKTSVARDLQTLLNARCLEEVPGEFPEVKASMVTFGLPDMQQLDCRSHDDQELVRSRIEEAALRFEPRFQRIRVTAEPTTEISARVRFRMNVSLVAPAYSTDAIFDASLDVSSRRYVVDGEN